LVPRFGLNDIVRPVRSYQRHVLNVGYYLAINDYLDFLVSADWYAARYLSLRAKSSYRWLDRFIDGGISFERYGLLDVPGSSIRLGWQHQQRFSSRTRFSASVDYSSNTRVIQTNTVNPFLATAALASQMSFTKQFDWGTLSVGGNRRQQFDIPDTTVPGGRRRVLFDQTFSTTINWQTGINLPSLFTGTWKLQPAIAVVNQTSQGPFMVRNQFTNGQFLRQGKRLQFSAGMSPTFFGFFPGIGPIARIRHAISPQISDAYAPGPQVDSAFAYA